MIARFPSTRPRTRASALAFAIAIALAIALFGALLVSRPTCAYAEDDGPSSSDAQTTNATSVDENEANFVDPAQRADNTFIYDTTIEEIIDETSVHEGRVVQFVGEAIGDRIIADVAGKYCWVTVESMEPGSDSNISVYMTVEQAAQIDRFGRYGVTGTTLQVRGTFNQACSAHEGQLDVHATSVEVMAHGVDHPDQLNLSNFGLGALLVLIGAALMAAFHFARERLR